jgi:mannose-6-phosphate isomerase-like protein (cupin superfamily)
MPKGTAEVYHYHERSQQLFYILSGVATFELNNKVIVVKANESIHVPAKLKHRIINNSDQDLHFLVISEPMAHGDRINI